LIQYRHIGHYLVGIILALASLVSWSLLIAGTAAFIIYELDQEADTHDKGYKDILEFIVGYCVACVGLIVWRIFL